jgi:type I restriction enzyme S subunit
MSDVTLQSLGPEIEIKKGRQPKSLSMGIKGPDYKPYVLIENFGQRYSVYTNDADAVKIFPSDVLVVWDGERAGLCSVGHHGYLGSTLAALRPSTKLRSDYLYFTLCRNQQRLRNLAEGTGVPHLSRSTVESLQIRIPPLGEQKKIAEILTTVDDVIENTEAEISKLEDLKKATMNELFTKGIGHTEFKETEIGRIPKSWGVIPLGEVCSVKNGYAFKSEKFTSNGIPIIRISNIQAEAVSMEGCVYYEPSRELDRYLVHSGDILVAMSGATTGKIGLYSGSAAYLNQRVGKFVVSASKALDSQFLYFLLITQRFKNLLAIDAIGGAQPNISADQIERILIPLPPQEEQIAVVAAMQSLVEHVYRSYQKILRLTRLKKAISEDLLSGRMRVKVN